MVQAWIMRHKIHGAAFISSHILLSTFMSISQAQLPSQSSLLISTRSTTTETTTITLPITIFTSSTFTTFLSLPPKSTSSITSRSTADARPPLFQPTNASDQYDPNEQQKEKAFNYYFLILGGIVFAVALILWWIRRKKRQQKEQMRLSGQNALARDLDGWGDSRRWIHGTWRQNQSTTIARHEEGLNEQGEAPPPYQPKNEVSGETRDSSTGLAVPMHTLSRDDLDRFRPPAYQVSPGSNSHTNSQLDAVERVPAAELRDIHTAPSTRIL